MKKTHLLHVLPIDTSFVRISFLAFPVCGTNVPGSRSAGSRWIFERIIRP
jgi:hypothetical protein